MPFTLFGFNWGCVLRFWKKSGRGERYVRKEPSNEIAHACGRQWVGLGPPDEEEKRGTGKPKEKDQT